MQRFVFNLQGRMRRRVRRVQRHHEARLRFVQSCLLLRLRFQDLQMRQHVRRRQSLRQGLRVRWLRRHVRLRQVGRIQRRLRCACRACLWRARPARA